jgi:hypothetical protein
MIKNVDCIFSKHCEAPMCPNQTREENKKGIWFPDAPICKLKDVPDWVKQQRRIAYQIKARNAETYFELVMLETPFRVKSTVSGIVPDEDICRNCQMIEWFIENRLPIPEEIENAHQFWNGSDAEGKIGQTIH